MRLLVCGHREFDSWHLMESVMESYLYTYPDKLFIIEGGAKGADFLARVWAVWANVPYKEYKADWKTYGKRAGPIRNKQMLDEGKPDQVLAFLAEGSVGTADMIRQAEKAGVPVKVIKI